MPKILNQTLAARIQRDIKKSIHHDQVGLIPGMQGRDKVRKSGSVMHSTNLMKEKSHRILATDAEKAFHKSPAPVSGKNAQQGGNCRIPSPPTKGHM